MAHSHGSSSPAKAASSFLGDGLAMHYIPATEVSFPALNGSPINVSRSWRRSQGQTARYTGDVSGQAVSRVDDSVGVSMAWVLLP